MAADMETEVAIVLARICSYGGCRLGNWGRIAESRKKASLLGLIGLVVKPYILELSFLISREFVFPECIAMEWGAYRVVEWSRVYLQRAPSRNMIRRGDGRAS